MTPIWGISIDSIIEKLDMPNKNGLNVALSCEFFALFGETIFLGVIQNIER